MVNAKEELLKQVPEVVEQTERFREVFGEDVAGRIAGEERTFVSGGGGGRAPPTAAAPPTAPITPKPPTVPITPKPTAQELRNQRQADLNKRVQSNLRQGINRFAGFTNSNRIFLRGQEARNIRETARARGISPTILNKQILSAEAEAIRKEASKRGVDISTRAKEIKFTRELETSTKDKITEAAKKTFIDSKGVVVPFAPITTKVKAPLSTRARNIVASLPGGKRVLELFDSGRLTLIDVEKRFPTIETIGGKKIPKAPTGFVSETTRTPFTPTGAGTAIVQKGIREKTFFENLGVKEDKDATKLQTDVTNIQDQLVLGKITEEEANKRLDTRLDKFVTLKAIKGLPKTVAIGAAVVVLQAVPILGQVVGGALIGDAVLKRRKIVEFTRNFPKAAAINTAGFIAGGLVGSIIKGGISSATSNKIDPDSIKSVTGITGKGKTKLINQIEKANLDPQLTVLRQQKKITGTIAYDIALKDGRTFRVLEFNKLKPADLQKGLQGEKNFLAFELTKVPKLGERVFGKGITVVTNGKSQTFLRALRFKPANSPIGRALQRFGFKREQAINILEKSRVIKVKGQATRVISESRILSLESINRNLGRKVANIEGKLQKGNRISFMEIKSLINLERRANNLKPFTDAEFRSAGSPTITDTLIGQVIKKARISFTKNDKIISASATVKTGTFGIAKTKPGEFFGIGIKTAKVKKTPLSKTFGKEPLSLADFSKQIRNLFDKSKGATGPQLKSIANQVSKLQNRLVGSPGAITLALANKLKTPFAKRIGIPKIPEPTLRVTSTTRLKFGESFKISQIPANQIKIKSSQLRIQKLKGLLKEKQKQKFSQGSITLTQQAVKQQQKTLQKLKQSQTLAQKLKSKQRQRRRTIQKQQVRVKLQPPKLKFTPPIERLGKFRPKKIPIPITRIRKQIGYNAFAKKRKSQDFLKLNLVPLRKSVAKSLGSFAIDRSLSATSRIRKAGKPAQRRKQRFDPKYFQKNRKKFRSFMIRGGKRIKTPNQLIEKRAHRLDFKSETQSLNSFKRKLRRTKPKPRKKVVVKKPINKKPFKSDGSNLSKNLRRRKK